VHQVGDQPRSKQHAVEAAHLQTKPLGAQKKACGIILKKNQIKFLENKKSTSQSGY